MGCIFQYGKEPKNLYNQELIKEIQFYLSIELKCLSLSKSFKNEIKISKNRSNFAKKLKFVLSKVNCLEKKNGLNIDIFLGEFAFYNVNFRNIFKRLYGNMVHNQMKDLYSLFEGCAYINFRCKECQHDGFTIMTDDFSIESYIIENIYINDPSMQMKYCYNCKKQVNYVSTIQFERIPNLLVLFFSQDDLNLNKRLLIKPILEFNGPLGNIQKFSFISGYWNNLEQNYLLFSKEKLNQVIVDERKGYPIFLIYESIPDENPRAITTPISNNHENIDYYQISFPENTTQLWKDKKDNLPIGLPNLYANCFANSIIQCLFHIDIFRENILNISKKEKFVLHLSELFTQMKKKNEKGVLESLRTFLKISVKDLGKYQDTFAFLLDFLQKLDDILGIDNHITKIFKGKLTRIIKCNHCNAGNNQIVIDFPLNISKKYYKPNFCTNLFYKPYLEGICPICNQISNELANEVLINIAPTILIIRLEPTYGQIDDSIKYSQSIALIEEFIVPDCKVRYTFCGGTFARYDGLNASHFIACLKNEKSKEYYIINDRVVKSFTKLETKFIPNILFYKKICL